MPDLKPIEKKVPVSAAILIGSLMISLSILLSGGVLTIQGSKPSSSGSTLAVTAPPQAAPAGKTQADMVKNLKDFAGKLGLDQSKFDACLDSGEKASLVSADLNDGNVLGVNGTPAFLVNGRPMFQGAVPYAQFKSLLDEELNNPPSNIERKTVSVGNSPVRGDVNAKVTMIEFSDYQCPFCEKFYQESEKQIKKDYVDTGKVKFYYRDFPLSQIHLGAEKGAEAARCAGDQGKYWEYHDLVFENQSTIF